MFHNMLISVFSAGGSVLALLLLVLCPSTTLAYKIPAPVISIQTVGLTVSIDGELINSTQLVNPHLIL